MSDQDRIGIGTIYLMIASLANVVSNSMVHIGLARFLDPETYGIFGVLISLFLINRGFLGSGIPKAAAKYISESRENTGIITRIAAQIQLILAVILTIVFIIFSDTIAGLLNDPTLSDYIKVIGLMVIPLALLFLYFDGYLNGLRQFKNEARAKILYAALRVIFVFLFVLLGFRIFGVLLGYFLAIVAALLISIALFKVNIEGEGTYEKKKILFFCMPMIVQAFTWILLRDANVLMIKSLLGDNAAAGFYTAAAALSDVIYITFGALSITILPAISESVSSGNSALTRKYITEALRYLLLCIMPITALICATATNLVTLLYSGRYSPAGDALRILTISTMFLIMLLVFIAIITGSGNPLFATGISVITLAILLICSYILIPIYGIRGAASASVIASVAGFAGGAAYVYFRFRALTKIMSVLRITGATAVIFTIAMLFQPSGILLVAYYAVLITLYLFLLYILGEVSTEDKERIRKMLRNVGINQPLPE